MFASPADAGLRGHCGAACDGEVRALGGRGCVMVIEGAGVEWSGVDCFFGRASGEL